MSKPVLFRRLLNLPIQKKLYWIIGSLVLNISIVMGLGVFGMSILSSLRAYVGGEGLWAKSQKNAIYCLSKYALSRDEKDYQAFLDHLSVPIGDRKARLELEKPAPDLAAADAGFIQGQNDPEDVRGMELLFLRYYRIRYIRKAIALWREADSVILDLQRLANDMHREISLQTASKNTIQGYITAIDSINERLTSIENEFSYTLGEASRWAKRTMLWVMLIGSALLGLLSLFVALLISKAITSGVDDLLQAAGRVERGDLRTRAQVHTKDEVGLLAEAFNRMTEGLSKMDQLKNDFVSTVSHELRTPLTLTMAPLESMLSEEFGPLDPEQRKMLEVMHNNAVRLLQMVTGLLDFSKLEARKIEVRREPVEIVSLTSAIIGDFLPLAKKKGIDMDLKAQTDARIVEMDRYLYERILFNLLSNAVKFTPAAGHTQVSLIGAKNRISLAVRDTGIGISQGDQKHLFEKFKQIESSSTRRFEGAGLGLALVKEFSVLLGGDVLVESNPGAGSVFTVDVEAPACRIEAATSEVPALDRKSSGWAQKYDGDGPGNDSDITQGEDLPLVLIAEDNMEMAGYLSRLLREICRTRIAHDGEEALEAVKREAPDIVIADVMMPKKDGLSLCRSLKSNPETARIPVVLLSALTDRESMLRGWQSGADEYLFKPFHPNEVGARIRYMLASIRERRATEDVLALKTEELLRSNADLDRFASVAAHDLQEPLRKIVNFSQLFQETYKGRADADGNYYLQCVVQAALRMQTLISDLLEFSRAGSREGSFEPVDCRAIFDRAVENLTVRINEAHGEVTCDPLPAVRANTTQLIQLFQNLIGNALKFRSQETPRVHIGSRRADTGEWLFVVSDNGIGFNMQYRERIFNVFERLHNRTEYPGNGIGLAICKKIVERHGGTIWAESEPGKGTSFYFTLPGLEENLNGYRRKNGLQTKILRQFAG